jgi:predicted RNA polymerase sigma factor
MEHPQMKSLRLSIAVAVAGLLLSPVLATQAAEVRTPCVPPRAVAVWKLQGPEAALEMIDPLKSELDAYFYLHALRGALLKDLNGFDESRDALSRAIALANSVAEAKLIRRELDSLSIA